MPAPIIPWQPSNVPSEITAELNRRKINRSFNFIAAQKANWDSVDDDWNTYRGPMVSWIRMCSNGAGRPSDATLSLPPNKQVFDKETFVLYSGKGFYQTYGFQPPDTNAGSPYQVIGYTAGDYANNDFGKPHVIENSLIKPSDEPVNYPIHVPAPEISRMEATVQKELFRRAQIEWVCFSWKQLVYMTPYFLVPGITCMIEWGWNHYNVQSLVNLGDRKQLRSLWDNAYPLYTKNILKSNGNYDVVYGIISNFNWSIEGNKIICTTEITSKDRLYSGIAKDNALSVSDQSDPSKVRLFKSLQDFINDRNSMANLKSLVSTANVEGEIVSLNKNVKYSTWYNILNPLLTKTNGETDAQVAMRLPYVFGVFSGRPRDSYGSKEKFGTPRIGDFDKGLQDKDEADKFWINMGLVTRILNYHSALPSGANDGNNTFEVDIQNSVIGAHPNMISCDPRVLIPNYQAPKFFYGSEGISYNQGQVKGKAAPYAYQVTRLIPVTEKSPIANQRLQGVMKQPGGCYRDDLDSIINYNRYRYTSPDADISSYSFPANFSSNSPLPISPRGLAGNKIEKDRSGLLSNIYISYSLLKDAINDESVSSFPDIYTYILNVLMSSVDGFWDLAVVDVDGVLTITDRKFIGRYAITEQQEIVYSFDYYDADSIIKGLKFRPVLSDAQATRVMYGAVNNSGSRYTYLDKNDILDYKFKDAVIGTQENRKQNNSSSELDARHDAEIEQRDLLRSVQTINADSDDGSLQMSLRVDREGSTVPAETPLDMPEIVKLVMINPPGQQLLRSLFNDDDQENNGRYCAVQPGIILELTLQGIGGLRTFQYFTIKNLPEPYSDRNIIFRVTDVNQVLETGNWETTIRAQPLPLRGYIKSRLIGPLGPNDKNGGWPPDVK